MTILPVPARAGKVGTVYMPPQAVAAPQPPVKIVDRLSVRLQLGDGTRMWRPTRRKIGVTYAPGGSNKSGPGQYRFVVNRRKLRDYLTKTAKYINHKPVDAHPAMPTPESDVFHDKYISKGTGSTTDTNSPKMPIKLVPARDGVQLNLTAAVDTVQQAIQQYPETIHIVLPVQKSPAKVHAAALQGIDARLGYFVTRFNPGEVGRTQTVRRAISLVDGTIVAPGAVFSLNQTVGERTAERGFGAGIVFVDGKLDKQVGGGMCQVATTLFNASMLAGLKIVERHQHVRTIPYAEPGRDATVYYGQKDFQFQNNTDAPIYISYRTTARHAICALYGKAVPGQKIKLVDHFTRLGDRHYRGVFYRVIYNPDGTKQKDKPFYSSYKWTPALDYSH